MWKPDNEKRKEININKKMNSSSDQFKNQPRLGAAIRQRSHSAQELATMLQQLQLSVQLMPLSNQSTKSNLQSTSEEESDMNSNETSTSEDEAFGDFEEEEEDYEFETGLERLKNYHETRSLNRPDRTHERSKQQRTNAVQLNGPLVNRLFYPTNLRRLRRSNSLGMLTSLTKQTESDYYAYDEETEFNRPNNRSFRTGRRRFSSSLKDLNQYNRLNDTCRSDQQFRLSKYFGSDTKTPTRSSIDRTGEDVVDFVSSLKRMQTKQTKQTKSDDNSNSLTVKSSNDNQHDLVKCLGDGVDEDERRTTMIPPKQTNVRLTNGKMNDQLNQLNYAIQQTNLRSSNSVQHTTNITTTKPLANRLADQHSVNCAATSDSSGGAQPSQSSISSSRVVGNCSSQSGGDCTSPDINNKVNFKSSVSSSCKASDECSTELDYFELKTTLNPSSKQAAVALVEQRPQLEQTSSESVVLLLNAVGQRRCDDCKDYRRTFCLDCVSSSSKDQQEQQQQQTTKQVIEESELDLLASSSFDEVHHLELNEQSTKFDNDHDDNQLKASSNCSSSNLDCCDLGLADNQSVDDQLIDDLDVLKDVLLNKPQLRLSDRRSRRLNLQSNLDVLEEESCRMHALAETQYNQLSYHIAALSCVCDSSNKNLPPYSPFNTSSSNNQSSSVDSSPNSSEYSSPYSSPPSSPSSVSSYSSAEEDCTILSNVSNRGHTLNGSSNSSSNSSSTSSLSKSLSGSNQSLADLITVNQTTATVGEPSNDALDVVDCASTYRTNHHHHPGLLTATNLAKLNDLNNNSDKEEISNDGSQLDSETAIKTSDQQSPNSTAAVASSINQSTVPNSTTNNKQARVRKTSILRNQAPDLTNYCKKEVKFADTLGFALEKVKYFPPNSPQVKPKRHSVNLASLQRDYHDEHQELLILHSRPQTKDNESLAKQFEERSALYSKQQSKLNLSTNIFGSGSQRRGTYSPPHQSSNSFWASYSTNYQPFSPIRDEYCGDMFHQPFDSNLPANAAQLNSTTSTLTSKPTSTCSVSANLMNSFTQMINYKSPGSLEFNGLNFMNNALAVQSGVSFLPLNFGQPYIQSDFPNRLRSQSVLLHSLDVVGNTVNGIISVINLTFEKKLIVKYTLNKWATEKCCEARYSKKDCDSSDKFVFQITLKEHDFPQFQLNEDRTMMFAIRYETGDGRIYWDNNYGQDYRLKCKFN